MTEGENGDLKVASFPRWCNMICVKCGYSGQDILIECRNTVTDIVECPKCGNQQEQPCDFDEEYN